MPLDNRTNICQRCSCVAGHCSFLGQNIDHHGSGMPKTHGEEPFHALKSRSEDEKTVPGKSIDTIFASSEDMP